MVLIIRYTKLWKEENYVVTNRARGKFTIVLDNYCKEDWEVLVDLLPSPALLAFSFISYFLFSYFILVCAHS